MNVPASAGVRQAGAFGGMAWRELRWVVPHVSRELAECRRLAATIPDPTLRNEALRTLESERLSAEGAALFSTVPRRRSITLATLLATYQVIVDYLDTVSERPTDDVVANGKQLYTALYDALDPGAPARDYYRLHPCREDGGYLRTLVETCQRACLRLPGFERVQPRLLADARRLDVTAINHEPDPERRMRQLRAWAEREVGDGADCSWFELTAAATSSVTVHALLTLAVSRDVTEDDIESLRLAYFPWMSLASTMLDSYADMAEDLATGDHSYVSLYGSDEAIVARLAEIVDRCIAMSRRLPRGERHALIATGMVALYLSSPSFGAVPAHARASDVLSRCGRAGALQLHVLRAWRQLLG